MTVSGLRSPYNVGILLNFRILLGLCLTVSAVPGLYGQVVIGRDGRLPGVRRFHYTSLDGEALVRAARSGNPVQVQIGGQLHRLKLELNDMRGAGYQATIIGPDGEREIAVPPPATYKGKLDDDPASEVRFTITDRGVHGFAAFGKSWYFIEPTTRQNPAQPVQHIEYSAADAESLPDTYNDVIMTKLGPSPQASVASPATTGLGLTASIILDADAEFYNLDPVNWMTAQQAVLNDVEGIYAAEVNVQFRIRMQTVHTNSADFTGTAVCSGTGQDLIVQLNNYWSARREGRDLVHLFSGKSFSGAIIGCTYEPSIGNNIYSAGLTQQIASGSSSYSATALQKALVVAHEIGHAFNGDHGFAVSTFDSACNCYDDTIMTASFSGTSITPGGHRIVNHFSDGNKSRITTQGQSILCSIPAGSSLITAAASAFEDKYQTAGERQVLGCATDNARTWFSGNVQDFGGGTGGTGAILLANSLTTAAWLNGNVWTYYSLNGGPGRAFADGSLIGYPIQDAAAGAPSTVSGATVIQAVFQNGQVVSYTGGARSGQSYAMRGAILTKWSVGSTLLGTPIAEEAAAAVSPFGTAGRTQTFENGQIYWHTSGAHNASSYYVHAAIATKYSSLGGSASTLGFPESDEYAWGGGTRNDFEGGYISAISSTATVVLTPETISKPSIPSGPASGITGTSYTYSASGAVSSKSNPVRYRVIFGDGTDSGWLASGVTSASKSWAAGGTYNVTVQAATTDLSITSALSDPLLVNITAPLTAPVLASPADGASGVSTSTALSWNAVNGSASYSVYFGTANPPPLVLVAAGTTYSPVLSAGTTYYWAVASRDPNNGNTEARAPIRSFTTAIAAVSMSFNSTPPGAAISVDGTTSSAPFTTSLAAGQHTISTPGLYSGSPGTQYVFSGWADGPATTSRTITVGSGQPVSYSSSYTTQYQLTVNASPAAGGSVAPASGSFYNAGTPVVVTASPASGYVFANWSGSVASASSASTSVTLSAAQTVTANFASLSGITFQSNPPGLPITVDGNTQTAPFSVQLAPGTHTIAASTIASGATRNVFASWSDGGGAAHSITVSSGQPATFTANYTTQYQLTVSASPAQGGSINPSGSSFYNAGAVVGLSAGAASGYVFSGWSGGVASGSNPGTTVTMTGPLAVTANFVTLSGTTFQSNPPGMPLTVDGSTQTAPFSVQLAPGTHAIAASTLSLGSTQNVFASWSDGGSASHAINIVAGQAAVFTANYSTQYQLTVLTSPAGTGTATPSVPAFYNAGSPVTITANPSSGYTFTGWSGGASSPSSASTTVLMTGPLTLTANFLAISNGAVSSTVFVRQLYRDLLNRDPDSGGLAFYVAGLDGGHISRSQLAAQFFTSPEFNSAGLYIVKLYLAVLGRQPDFPGWQFWFNGITAGQSTDVVLTSFLSSPEFTMKYGNLSDTDFITLVYRSVLGRDPDLGGLQYYQYYLGSHQLTRSAVFDQFLRSSEYGTRSAPQSYANLLYMGFLRRSADTAGLTYWAGALTNGLQLSDAISEFIQSPEYLNRLSLVAP